MSEQIVDSSVRGRYAAAASAKEAALCCPVDYDVQYLKVIPQEVIDRDYGCGDPSKYLREGETVLDLGSGTGKICFIASQVVGESGKVIGIDMTDEMLDLARRSTPVVAERIGYSNVEFRKGRIQDMKLDLELLDVELRTAPIDRVETFLDTQSLVNRLKSESPLVKDEEVDVVVSNCVLNLVSADEKPALFEEIFRVLKPGGRAVISDIVSDEPSTEAMRNDPELWSGCISGALTESEFLEAFQKAGFEGIRIMNLETDPWRVEQGIEFHSMTIEAFKGSVEACMDRGQAVIYRGPFQSVIDDSGNILKRGQRTSVCEKDFETYQQAPYAEHFIVIESKESDSLDKSKAYDRSLKRLQSASPSTGDLAGIPGNAKGEYRSGGSCC